MYNLQYQEGKILYAKFSNKVLTEEFIKLSEEIYKNHRSEENIYILLDLTNIEISIDYNVVATDMYEVKKIAEDYLKSNGGIFVAIVAEESVTQMLIHFYETLASDLENYDLRTFETLDKARQWLIQT